MPKGKTLGKRRNNIYREIALAETALGPTTGMNQNAGVVPFEAIRQSIGMHGDNLTPQEQLKLYKAMKQKYNRGIDLGYIKTILFPEYFKYDIPSPLTNLSYCKFDDKQNAEISTGPLGTGMLIWYPKVTCGPSVFVQYGITGRPLPTQAGAGTFFNTGSIVLNTANTNTGFEQYYQQYFTQTQLVAASLSIQYIGQQELESGLWVGGHIYGQTLDALVLDDIENSQYVTRARPNEGLRFVYLPGETQDYEYYPTSLTNAHNAGAEPSGNEQVFTWPLTGNVNLGGSPYTPALVALTSASATVTYASNTSYVAIYWTGFPAGNNWIRIDATRQFNGIPKQQYRNIVSVSRCKKNFNSKRTFDVLRTLCVTQSSVGGHTLKDMDAQMDRIVEALPNIEAAINSGEMDTGVGLEGLAISLEKPMSSANQKGLFGNVPGPTGRIYPYA